jgi:hypothetical protein
MSIHFDFTGHSQTPTPVPLTIDEEKSIPIKQWQCDIAVTDLNLEKKRLNDSQKEIDLFHGEIVALSARIRKLPTNSDMKIWKSERKLQTPHWQREKSKWHGIQTSIHFNQNLVSKILIDLNVLLVRVSKEEVNNQPMKDFPGVKLGFAPFRVRVPITFWKFLHSPIIICREPKGFNY